VEPRFRIRAYPTADRYLRRSTLRIALSETTPVSSSFPEPNRLDAVASVANWAAVSIPPGSRTRTSAPSVAWCTCRAPRQASSPRFWPPGQR
jgi:hypothetical protein